MRYSVLLGLLAVALSGSWAAELLHWPGPQSFNGTTADSGGKVNINAQEQLTVEAWFYPNLLNQTQVIFYQFGAYGLNLNANNTLQAYVYGKDDVPGATVSAYSLTYNTLTGADLLKWHYICLTVNAATMQLTLYLDGVEVAQQVVLTPAFWCYESDAAETSYQVGAAGGYWRGGYAYFYNGQVAHCRVLTTARTASEVATVWATGYTGGSGDPGDTDPTNDGDGTGDLGDTINNWGDTINDTINNIGGDINETLTNVTTTVTNVVNTVGEGIKGAINGILSWLQNTWNTLWAWLQTAWEATAQFFANVWQWCVDMGIAFAQWVMNFFQWAGQLWEGLTNFIKWLWQVSVDALNPANWVNWVAQFFWPTQAYWDEWKMMADAVFSRGVFGYFGLFGQMHSAIVALPSTPGEQEPVFNTTSNSLDLTVGGQTYSTGEAPSMPYGQANSFINMIRMTVRSCVLILLMIGVIFLGWTLWRSKVIREA